MNLINFVFIVCIKYTHLSSKYLSQANYAEFCITFNDPSEIRKKKKQLWIEISGYSIQPDILHLFSFPT